VSTVGESMAGLTYDLKDDIAVLKPWGTLDLEGAAQIRGALDEAASKPATRYLVDMQEVQFIDGSGLRELMRTLETVRARGARMSVINSKPQFARLLVLTGANRRLDPPGPLGLIGA